VYVCVRLDMRLVVNRSLAVRCFTHDSAMTWNAFGPHLDVHAGGVDLRFPHHANEIAQCEARTAIQNCEVSARWPRFLLHVGHLDIAGLKMSKSLKNFVTVREFLADGGTATQFRIFCLMHKYNR
jgi:cysteinyl-tRNA synthetase